MDWCYMCKSEEESVAHSFLHCDFARQLWSLVFSLFGVNWVILIWWGACYTAGKDYLERVTVKYGRLCCYVCGGVSGERNKIF